MDRPELICAICDSAGNGLGNKFIEASAQHITDGSAYIAHLEARVKELEEKAPSMVLHGIQRGKQLAQSGGALMWDNEMVSPADYARKLVQANISAEAD